MSNHEQATLAVQEDGLIYHMPEEIALERLRAVAARLSAHHPISAGEPILHPSMLYPGTSITRQQLP